MDSKVFMFPESSNGNLASVLAPLLQQRGIDPNVLLAMNKNNGAFGCEGGWFMWVIFLFFLMGWGGNGWGGFGRQGGLANEINNDYGRDLLMQAINGNGNAINSLATNLNCSVGQIQSAINGVMGQVSGIGNQLGLTGQQVINAIQQGDTNIAQQICDCCCKTNNNITTQGYESKLAICQQTHSLNDTANTNALMLRDAGQVNTNAILSKLDQMSTQALHDKIEALREKNNSLMATLSNEHQTALIQQSQTQSLIPVNAALNDLSNRLAKIECNQPEVAKVPYTPAMGGFIPVNYGINASNISAASGCGCV